MSHFHLQEEIAQPSSRPLQPEVIHNPHYQEYLKLSSKQWHFSDLLPMDKEKTILCDNKQKIQVLNILKHLYQAAADALYAFYIDRRADLFDAHVGESACQIRAVKLAVMLKHTNIKDGSKALDVRSFLINQVDKVNNMLDFYRLSHRNLEKGLTIKDFLCNYNLDTQLNPDYLFVVVCFVLSVNKLKISPEKYVIKRRELMKAFKSGKAVTNRIVTNFQKIASYLSVRYVFSSVDLCDQEERLLSYQLQKDSFGRWVLPTLVTFEFVLSQIKNHKLPVCLKITVEGNENFSRQYSYLFSKGLSAGSSYLASKSNDTYPYPVVLIQGFVKDSNHTISSALYKSCLDEYKLSAIILANIATHFQYSGSNLVSLSRDPYLVLQGYFDPKWLEQKLLHLRDLQAFALGHGFCKFNPELLALTHVACTTQNLI